MQWGTETKVFFSVSGKPGNFGASVYNFLFKELDINAVYLPRKVLDAAKLIESIRTLGINGCSVSMPLKGQVVEHLDELEDLAQATQSVNTILNEDGKLIGHNTDCYGAQQVLERLKPKSVLVYGACSVTASVLTALRNTGCTDIAITGRTISKAEALAKQFGAKVDDGSSNFELLINTTPASKDPENKELFGLLDRVEGLFDLPVSPTDVALVAQARQRDMILSPGFEMSKFQLQKQFSIYTGIWPEIEMLNKALELNGFV